MNFTTLLIVYSVGWLSGVLSVLLWGILVVRNTIKGN